MKDRHFLLGLLLLGVFKLIFAILKKVIEVLSYIIVYFGLYFPLFYLIFGIVLISVFNLDISGYTPELGLYLVGLILSAVYSVIVTLKRWDLGFNVFKPFRNFNPRVYFENVPAKARRDNVKYDEEEEEDAFGSDLENGVYYVRTVNGRTIVEDADGNRVRDYGTRRR